MHLLQGICRQRRISIRFGGIEIEVQWESIRVRVRARKARSLGASSRTVGAVEGRPPLRALPAPPMVIHLALPRGGATVPSAAEQAHIRAGWAAVTRDLSRRALPRA
jgi:hypothetical protein